MRFVLCIGIVIVVAGAAGCESDCTSDSDCSGGEVCARDQECLSSDQVYAVRITWTLGGQAASATTCADHPDLVIEFHDDGGKYEEDFGFAPVPCMEGVFPVDHMPTSIDHVELGFDDGQDNSIDTVYADIGADGTANLDLPAVSTP